VINRVSYTCPRCARTLATEGGLNVHLSMAHYAPVSMPEAEAPIAHGRAASRGAARRGARAGAAVLVGPGQPVQPAPGQQWDPPPGEQRGRPRAEPWGPPPAEPPLQPSGQPPLQPWGAPPGPPSSPPSSPPWSPPPPPAPPPPGPTAPRHSRLATRTVVGIILANLVVQAMAAATAAAGHLSTNASLVLSLVVALGFYAGAAVYVAVRSNELGVRAIWLSGPAPRAVLLGLVVGGGAAAGLSIAMRAAVGHTVVDPMAGLLAGEPAAVLLVGLAVMAGLAPVVEEFVFRGFLAESLRERGGPTAIVLSAAAFSLAHLRFAQFRYYLLMGIALGAIYWGRGLVGSIAAHAAFNGSLVVVALLAAHGPAATVHADGVTFRLPGEWHQLATSGSVDLRAVGPGGSQLQLSHQDLPSGASLTVDSLASALRSGRVTVPGDATLDPESVQVAQLPVGPVLRLHAVVKGRGDDSVILTGGDRFIVFDLLANGSNRASQDFEAVLQSMRSG
jgi:membrane protease YdiL (CAAX protease family)